MIFITILKNNQNDSGGGYKHSVTPGTQTIAERLVCIYSVYMDTLFI